MDTPTKRHIPGAIPTFVTDQLVALVAASAEHPVLPALHQVVTQGGRADDVLATLQQWAAWGLPEFCVCERTPTGFRLVIRGRFEVRPDDEPAITANVDPWVDGTVTNEAVTIRALMDSPATGPALPLDAGFAHTSLVRFATGRAAQLMRGASAPPAAADPASAPTVIAVRCPAGHLTPAYAPACRVCRAPVSHQDAHEIPRPALGALRLPDGSSIPLDGDLILGRHPSLPADPASVAPRLVRLPDHAGVSATHLEVVLDYWNVTVRDLGSTNGTAVTRPGRPPVRLQPFDLVMIEPGTVINLAGELTLEFVVDPA